MRFGDNPVTPDVSITAGEYFKATLAELGYDVPTDGQTAYSVKAYGLPAGLKLVSNKAVTKKVKKGLAIVVEITVVRMATEGAHQTGRLATQYHVVVALDKRGYGSL